MNSKPPPKPSPSYDGPTYLGRLPLPKRTDAPDADGVSESPSGIHRAFNVVREDVAKSRRLRIKVYSIGGALLLGVLTGGAKFALAKKETIEEKASRLDEHQKNMDQALTTLTTRVDAGEKAQQKSALKIQHIEDMVEMELKQHGIKPPPRVDE